MSEAFEPYRARKIGGAFQHTGTIVSEFTTTAGDKRIVLEFDAPVAGMLHIYRPDQVERIVPIITDALAQSRLRAHIANLPVSETRDSDPAAKPRAQRAEPQMCESKWMDIETAPKGITGALVCYSLESGEPYVEEAWHDDERDEWWPANTDYGDAHGLAIYPTHWMKLPEAPPSDGKHALYTPLYTHPPAQREPTAWRVYFPDEQRQEYCDNLDELIDDLTNCRHDEPEPLYLHPPAQRDTLGANSLDPAVRLKARLAAVPPAQREPLSDDQIVAIRDGLLPSQGEPFDCLAFARSIERLVRGEKP